MSTLDSAVVLNVLGLHGRQWKVQPSPRKGHIRIHDTSNDVTCAIDLMGGIERAAELLDVSVDTINQWIDEHYVPEPHVQKIRQHTRYSIWSLQRPTFYVFDGSRFWPHMPDAEEFEMYGGLPIYCPWLEQEHTVE